MTWRLVTSKERREFDRLRGINAEMLDALLEVSGWEGLPEKVMAQVRAAIAKAINA